MDPITLIVGAVAAGASAALKDTASQAVKDAYAYLKSLLTRRQIDLSGLERKPESESKQKSLSEDLRDLDGSEDAIDVLVEEAARRLLVAVKQHDPGTAKTVGIDLERLEVGGSLHIRRVKADDGVRGKEWKVANDAVFEDLQSIQREAPSTGSKEVPS